MMFELFLSKTLIKEAAPPPLANARQPAKKFSSLFLICARWIFSSKRKRKLFCWLLLLTEQAAGAASFCIRSGMAEFPPNPPSAMPLLKSRRAKIPSPQPPSFLPACLGFALKFFCGTTKSKGWRVGLVFFQKQLIPLKIIRFIIFKSLKNLNTHTLPQMFALFLFVSNPL